MGSIRRKTSGVREVLQPLPDEGPQKLVGDEETGNLRQTSPRKFLGLLFRSGKPPEKDVKTKHIPRRTVRRPGSELDQHAVQRGDYGSHIDYLRHRLGYTCDVVGLQTVSLGYIGRLRGEYPTTLLNDRNRIWPEWGTYMG